MSLPEARRACPELILVDGEDLTPFRQASKRVYTLLRAHSWNDRVERLGLDEVFMDVTDVVGWNVGVLNRFDLRRSWFCLERGEPERGFSFDAREFAGCVHYHGEGEPPGDEVDEEGVVKKVDTLRMRLLVASHLARYLREKIEKEEGYTSSCGISTNKVLAKLVGGKNKPRNQTTLLALRQDHVLSFMDPLPLHKVPGIGGRIVSVLENAVRSHPPNPGSASFRESGPGPITVSQVRTHPSITPSSLERLLQGTSTSTFERGLGPKLWALLHGADTSEVKPARDVPVQIGVEDTYHARGGLQTQEQARRAIVELTVSLLRRIRGDLCVEEPSSGRVLSVGGGSGSGSDSSSGKKAKVRWLARPRTIRLSSRANDSSAPYTQRVSRSAPLPSFVFSTDIPVQQMAERLVKETLWPLLMKILPQIAPSEKSRLPPHETGGWNIGLINIAVTNMNGDGTTSGRNQTIQNSFSSWRMGRSTGGVASSAKEGQEKREADTASDETCLQAQKNEDEIRGQEGSKPESTPNLGLVSEARLEPHSPLQRPSPNPEKPAIPQILGKRPASSSSSSSSSSLFQERLDSSNPKPNDITAKHDENNPPTTMFTAPSAHTLPSEDTHEVYQSWDINEDNPADTLDYLTENHDDDRDEDSYLCPLCNQHIPFFAATAHNRFHETADED